MANPYWYGQHQYGMMAPQPVPPPEVQQPQTNPGWGWNPYPGYGYSMQQYPQPYYPYPPQQHYGVPPQQQYGGTPQPVRPTGPDPVPPMSQQQVAPQPVPPMPQPSSHSAPQPVPQIESESFSQNGPQPVPPPPIEQKKSGSPNSEASGFHYSNDSAAAAHEMGPSNIHVQPPQMPQSNSQQSGAPNSSQIRHPQMDHQVQPPQQMMPHQPPPHMMPQPPAPQMMNQPPTSQIGHSQSAPQMMTQQGAPQIINQLPAPQMVHQLPAPQMLPQQPAQQIMNQPPNPQMSHPQPTSQMMPPQLPPNQMMPQQLPQQMIPQQPAPQMMSQQPPHQMTQQQPPNQMINQQPQQRMPYPGPAPPWSQQAPNFNQENSNYNPFYQRPNFNQQNSYSQSYPDSKFNQSNQVPNLNQGANYNDHNEIPNSNQYNGGSNHSYNDNPNEFNRGPQKHYNQESIYQYDKNEQNNNSFEREPWVNSHPTRENYFEVNDSYDDNQRNRNKRGRGQRKGKTTNEKRAKLDTTPKIRKPESSLSEDSLEDYKHLIEEAEREQAEREQAATLNKESDSNEEPMPSPKEKENVPEKVVVNDAVPIPEHLKGAVPRTGTTLSSPVVYNNGKPESQVNNSVNTSTDEVEESPQNIYSLANKYNSVCYERTEGFVNKKQSQVPKQPPKLPPPRRFNFEDPACSKLFCLICRIECPNETEFMTHFSGRKHLKNETSLKQIDSHIQEQIALKTYKINPNFPSNIHCNICDQKFPTLDLFKAHLKGFKHQHTACSFLTKGTTIPEIVPEYEIEVNEEMKNKVLKEINEFEESLKKGLPPPILPDSKTSNILIGEKFVVQHRSNKNMWYCRLCKVNLSPSQAVQIEHCKGRQHRGNFIYKMSDSENEAFHIFSGEIIPLVERTNWKEDCRHYSAQPNTLISFDAFRDHPCFLPPVLNSQIFMTNKKACPLIDFIEEDHCLEKKSSEITNGKSAISELYELVKYISKVAYKITYAINEILLEFQPGDSEEVRYQKSLDTINYKVANGLLIKQIENTPKNASCYYATVVRTDIIGKGYILNNEEKIDLVMICDFIPTKEILKLYEVGFTHILNEEEDRDRNITITSDCDSSSISILYMTLDFSPIIEVVLHITSKLYSNRDLAQLRSTPNVLNMDKGLHSLAEIRQMRWFKEKHIYYPYFMFVIRILRDFRRRNEPWRSLSLYSMELVLDHLLRSCKTFVSPAVLVKNFFRFFSMVKLNTQTMFGDVCEVDYVNPFKHLTDSQCEAIQRSAINALSLIESRKMNSVLYYPIPTEVKE